MEGVTVLSEKVYDYDFAIYICIAAIIVGIIAMCIAMHKRSVYAFVCMILLIITFTVLSNLNDRNHKVIQEIKISDEVHMAEFIKNYHIIHREGDIFTVELHGDRVFD